MKKLIVFSLLAFIGSNVNAQFDKGKWEVNPPIPLKKVDFNNSFLINSSSNFFQFDAIIYPVSLFFSDKTKLDYGIGGGVSTIEKYKLDPYVKLLINKDWKVSWDKKSRWGNDLITNYLFNSEQFNFGLNLTYTKGISNLLYSRMKACPSYFTQSKELMLSTTLTLGLEGEILQRQVKKPVVYFYPMDTLNLEVSLQFPGELSFCYPSFQEKWDFTIYPNSTFTDNSTNKEYPYLFWEGDYDMSQLKETQEGFHVKRESLVPFFEEKLAKLGLNRREITDFITFWTPTLLEENYQIQFITQEECNVIASYQFSEVPETFIRVIALFKPISKDADEIAPQILKPISRSGFTIVEWGGIELDEKKL